MKIFIVIPADIETGGPESLHQLASKLSLDGSEAYVYYYGKKTEKIPEKYREYNLKVTKIIEDIMGNIIIVPETLTCILKKYKNVKKVIWWLSLDYYKMYIPCNRVRAACKNKDIPYILSPIVFFGLLFTKRLRYAITDIGSDQYYHLYNCEYVKEYLIKNNVNEKRMMYLCGPLNELFFNEMIDINRKEDLVIYNPKKGYEYTSLIIQEFKKKNTNIKFLALENMSRKQIVESMSRAKIYLDLGYFPGPERLPREAVMLKCNIIVLENGSAVNEVDVPIPNKYKIKKDKNLIEETVNLIETSIQYFDNEISEFETYREHVVNQKYIFNGAKKILDVLLYTE